ncbi:Protein of unknown function [Pyronema omphalodes CBS 100304]|uniref:Uncharacterized protein n=1 Tax=Pyronema omphalodes (strain CBS 100304) TaxID=1076935 RepID=U4LPL5_PYROM|nr:Protein of unknown function [Pyronema omphalodes CBS 100304]
MHVARCSRIAPIKTSVHHAFMKHPSYSLTAFRLQLPTI